MINLAKTNEIEFHNRTRLSDLVCPEHSTFTVQSMHHRGPSWGKRGGYFYADRLGKGPKAWRAFRSVVPAAYPDRGEIERRLNP